MSQQWLSSSWIPAWTSAAAEVIGERTGCPSPLSVISPAVIWLAEMLAFPANLIAGLEVVGVGSRFCSQQIERVQRWMSNSQQLVLMMLSCLRPGGTSCSVAILGPSDGTGRLRDIHVMECLFLDVFES